MFTIIPGMTQDDITEVKPTENALSLLEVNSGSVIRQLLHNYMRQKGCMVHLQLGMCNSLKNLIIASFTDVFTCSNLYISHCGPEKVGDDLDENESAILTEKENLGELKKDDIAKLTKNEQYLPTDFWGFEHMLRNFLTLVSYIGGENCLTVQARKRALSHAQQHQALYKRYEKENEYFYLSVCNDLN